MDGHTKLRCFSQYLIVGAIVAATPALLLMPPMVDGLPSDGAWLAMW